MFVAPCAPPNPPGLRRRAQSTQPRMPERAQGRHATRHDRLGKRCRSAQAWKALWWRLARPHRGERSADADRAASGCCGCEMPSRDERRRSSHRRAASSALPWAAGRQHGQTAPPNARSVGRAQRRRRRGRRGLGTVQSEQCREHREAARRLRLNRSEAAHKGTACDYSEYPGVSTQSIRSRAQGDRRQARLVGCGSRLGWWIVRACRRPPLTQYSAGAERSGHGRRKRHGRRRLLLLHLARLAHPIAEQVARRCRRRRRERTEHTRARLRVRRWPLAAAGAVGHTRRTRLCHDRAWAQRRLDERCGWALRWDGEWRCTHRRLHAGNWLRLQPLRATFQRLAIRGSQSKRRSQERHVSTGGLGGGTAYPSCSTRRTGAKGRQRAGARTFAVGPEDRP
jgi:hypothetical protein